MTTIVAPTFRQLTALHEAGHATIGTTVGFHLDDSKINPDGFPVTTDRGKTLMVSGRTRWNHPPTIPLFDLLVMTYAGHAAQVEWFVRNSVELSDWRWVELRGLAAHDIDLIHRVMDDCGAPSEMYTEAVRVTKERVRGHWDDIELVTELLMEHGQVSGSMVRQQLVRGD